MSQVWLLVTLSPTLQSPESTDYRKLILILVLARHWDRQSWLWPGQTGEWILLERRERRQKTQIINGFPAQRKWSHRWTRSSEIASLSLMIKIDSCSQLCCGASWSLKMFSLSSCVFTRPTVILCVYNSSRGHYPVIVENQKLQTFCQNISTHGDYITPTRGHDFSHIYSW